MNLKRIAAAAVVCWVVAIGFRFIITDVLLAGLIDGNAFALRPEADVNTNIPIGFATMLGGLLAFSYSYARGHKRGATIIEGIRFGARIGLVVCGFGIVWVWVSMPVTWELGAAMMIDSIVELALYGGIVAAIYEPLPKEALPPSSPAAV